jgi:hypothetical protein
MKNSKDQYRCAGLLAAVIVFALLPEPAPSQTAVSSKEAIDTIWTVPNVGALPDDSDGRLVRRGRDLVTATYAYIGPEVSDRYAPAATTRMDRAFAETSRRLISAILFRRYGGLIRTTTAPEWIGSSRRRILATPTCRKAQII